MHYNTMTYNDSANNSNSKLNTNFNDENNHKLIMRKMNNLWQRQL